MPVTNDLDESLDYVRIAGPAVDALERRNESTSNPKIAASHLRRNLDRVKEGLFAEIRALIGTAPRRTVRSFEGDAE